MMSYWPWWAGALALGAITFVYDLVVGRRLGVSTAWARVVHWRSEREAERVDEAALAEAGAFEAMLAAATAAEFGAEPGGVLTAPAIRSDAESPPPKRASPPRRLPMVSNAVFLVSILAGALVASLVSGRFAVRSDMGEAFADIVVGGPLMWPTLFVGGVLVGVGTRMAGGCSSGHGLSGCSRLQPVSLVATGVFFGTAVAVSSLLYWVV